MDTDRVGDRTLEGDFLKTLFYNTLSVEFNSIKNNQLDYEAILTVI